MYLNLWRHTQVEFSNLNEDQVHLNLQVFSFVILLLLNNRESFEQLIMISSLLLHSFYLANG